MFSAPHSLANSRTQQFAGTYPMVGVQTMVAGATPHGLVALLFDGFMAARPCGVALATIVCTPTMW